MTIRPLFIALLVMAASAPAQAQGPLTPTGAPAASMLTLDQIEPRKPLTSGVTNLSISQSGSYYLTGNMFGTITVLVSHVELDLRGFRVLRSSSSSAAVGLATGIQNVKVRNGILNAYYGLSAPVDQTNNLSVEDVTLDGCTYGISAGHNLSARRIKGANMGGQRFIQGGKGSVVQDSSMVGGNPAYGIEVGSGSLVENCAIAMMKPSDTGGANIGISVGSGSIVRHCAVSDSAVGANLFVGINGAAGSIVASCTVKGNQSDTGGYAFSPGPQSLLENSVASGNTGITGIQVGSGSYIRNNAISGNIANFYGIYLSGPDNRVEDNLVTGHSVGIQAGVSGNFIARNTVSGNATNWNIADGNVCYVLPAVTTTNFVGTGGGVSPGTTNPYANFTF